jgi:hypothetical protein
MPSTVAPGGGRAPTGAGANAAAGQMVRGSPITRPPPSAIGNLEALAASYETGRVS